MTEQKYGWWAIKAWNQETLYGYGSCDEASRYCDGLNADRDINLYGPEWIAETDAEAQAIVSQHGVVDIVAAGVNLEDALAASDR